MITPAMVARMVSVGDDGGIAVAAASPVEALARPKSSTLTRPSA